MGSSLPAPPARIITKDDPAELMQFLRQHNYGVTSIDAEGGKGKVKMVFTIIKRQDLSHVVGIIKQFHPNAFYSVEEVKSVAEGVFPERNSHFMHRWFDSLHFNARGK